MGLFKFILRCAESEKRIHVLSGLDQGTIEKNIITKELGILDDFGGLVEYWPSGRGDDRMAHLVLHTTDEDKKIYVLGYADKARWKKALGGQYGCLYIDEINIADMDFVREASMRCDYLLATLNPDDPGLPVYEEYINYSRPLPEWERDTPREILELLNQEPKQGWVHWFFSFAHNAGLSAEKVEKIISMVPPGTKLYKNKILGLRGRATGLVFNLEDKSIITAQQAQQFKYLLFTAGLDTAYSQNSADTFAFTFWGVTTCRRLVGLDVRVYNNRDLSRPLTPSDIPPLFEQFLEANRSRWGFARDAFVDSADQATLLECRKYKQLHGSVYNYLDAWKKTKIIDRINCRPGGWRRDIICWCAKRAGRLLMSSTCTAGKRTNTSRKTGTTIASTADSMRGSRSRTG